MPETLVKMNLTHRQMTADQAAYFAIGGTTGLGKRVDVYQVSEEEFLRAAKNALKPLLDSVLRETDSAVEKFLNQTTSTLEMLKTDKKELLKSLRETFKAKIEAIAPTTSEGTPTVPAATVTISPDALS